MFHYPFVPQFDESQVIIIFRGLTRSFFWGMISSKILLCPSKLVMINPYLSIEMIICISRDGRRETDVSTRCRDPEAQMFRNTAPKRDSKHPCHVTKAIRSIGACHKCFETCIPADSAFD